MIQFYAPDIETLQILPEGESAHCARVLRMKPGDEIVVTDGKGARYFCEIVNSHPVHTSFRIKEKVLIDNHRDFYLTLAVAPTKNPDRMEWLAEKAVEIGVDSLVLLKCRRSERKFLKAERLRKVMVSALKQSLETRLPELVEMVDFEKFVNHCDKDSQRFFGYCSSEFQRKLFVRECKAGGKVVVMIGPEGDFSDNEVSLAVNNGFIPVSFGEKRLRTETAALFAVAAVNVINQLKK